MKKDDLMSIAWMLLLIGFVRAFIVEPFKIPSGSMIPTLLIGDHLFVAKSSYDIGIPFTDIKLMHVADPKRGDVIVFEYPNPEKATEKEGQYYIKRLIGLPGDHITIKGGTPIINDSPVDQQRVVGALPTGEMPDYGLSESYELLREALPSFPHPHWVARDGYDPKRMAPLIAELQARSGKDCIDIGKMVLGQVPFNDSSLLNEICPFTVPEGEYFMMGDNRDHSADSRDWGFVRRDQLKGRALFIWLSLQQEYPDPSERVDPSSPRFGTNGGGLGNFMRWHRLGLKIN